MAKYGAVAAGAKAIGDITFAAAEMRGEQELNNAVTDINDGLLNLDSGIENAETTFDADGMVVYDADKINKFELTERKALIGNARDKIKTASARRRFDDYTMRLNMQRNEQVQHQTFERERKTMLANSKERTKQLKQAGRWNDAISNVESDARIGVLGASELYDEKRAIREERDIDVITNAMLNPETTDTDIRLITESLTNGKWSSLLGFKDPTIELGDKERVMWQNQLYGEAASMDDKLNEKVVKAQEQMTDEYFQEIAKGNMDSISVSQIPLNEVGVAGKKYLVSQQKSNKEGAISSPAEVSQAESKILDLIINGSKSGDPERVKLWIRGNTRIVGDDQLTLMKQIDTVVNNVDNQRPQRAALHSVLVQLQGLTTEDTFVGSSDDKRSERIAGTQLKGAFWAYGSSRGAEFTEEDAQAWLEDNKVDYFRVALADTLATKGVDITAMPSDRIEADKWIRTRVIINLQNEVGLEYWKSGMTEDQRASSLADEMSSIELLMRHVWSD